MKKYSILFLCLFSVSFLASAQTKAKAKSKNTNKAVPAQTLTGSKPKEAPLKGQRVEITTTYGTIVVRLYDETPLHRDNFIKLVKQGFYDSLLFHRVIKSFMIQGGDPNSKNADSMTMLGAGDVGYKIPAEFNPSLYHKRGALAAARDNNPEKASSGCQFYIVQGRTYSTKEIEDMINKKNLNNKQELFYQLYQTDSVQAAINALGGDKEKMRVYMEQLQPVVDKLYKEKYPDANKVNMDQVQTYVEFGGTPFLDGAYTVFGELESGWEVLDQIAGTATRPGDRPVKDIRMKMRLIK